MEMWLKRGSGQEEVAREDAGVRAAVEEIIGMVAARGDEAVRALSVRFDGWDREDYRLTLAEIEGCLAELGPGDVRDIEFAQAQVRNFARRQREAK